MSFQNCDCCNCSPYNVLRKKWSDHMRCCCNMDEDDEDNDNKAKGRFGLAWVVEFPDYPPCPIQGWQVEFEDSPSSIEIQCQEMIKWVNSPPFSPKGPIPCFGDNDDNDCNCACDCYTDSGEGRRRSRRNKETKKRGMLKGILKKPSCCYDSSRSQQQTCCCEPPPPAQQCYCQPASATSSCYCQPVSSTCCYSNQNVNSCNYGRRCCTSGSESSVKMTCFIE